MNRRRDAATATAELALHAEARALADEDLGGHRRPVHQLQRLRQRGAGPLQFQPGHACTHQRPAQRHGVRREARPSIAERRRVVLHLEKP